MAKQEKPKFSAPALTVECPSCGVPKGCACRVIDTTGTTPGRAWTTPREPHFAREQAYLRWKIALFGEVNDVTKGHKLPYMRRSGRGNLRRSSNGTPHDRLPHVEGEAGVGMDS